MTDAAEALAEPFGLLPDLIRLHARRQPDKLAIADDDSQVTYAALGRAMDRVAAALQRDGTQQRQAVAMVSYPSVEQAIVFLGALRAGSIAAPIQPSATPEQIAGMIADSGANLVFLDAANADALKGQALAARIVRLEALGDWLAPEGATPAPVAIAPEDGFNIIYSSGTTGIPKGIVQSHAMRWQHFSRNAAAGFGTAVTLLSTPLYSNTTLVSFLPTLAWGGTVVLMKKFDAHRFLELAEKYRATHTMLVPVQYQRIMALPDFDRFDLSAFRFKTCTSAPFKPELKRDVVNRWPGKLVEYYGMTEGGASFALVADEFPDKLHTVGRLLPGHEAKLLDEEGNEVPPGGIGEIVGRSPAMMNGYHGRESATRDAEWFDAEGGRWLRHGDVGRFDEDGFLTLMDRKKDMIISGGFNVFPSDLEAVLAEHPAVADCTVVGVPSDEWGETPVGFYVPRTGATESAEDIRQWANARLGKTQRLSALHVADELPRSAIGKVLKRELRDRLAAGEFA
ncbi:MULTISPECIES: class I adenylate-forming enzyme family protein [unclassified Sphingomonas]|uniref:class I adenylate-forming enzyme family protein n=1 Tax=unclassified Sphingomonas TaxID=196159 RepID=UPI00092C57D1|nr:MULTISPECIES: class I adenylate-forming enzyme family protein [unclassified Sphingomonas]MBN8847672.1 acyl--CoA ligase [Sphingomonas sp.]OJV31790.1 MAG: 4-coumarate--CoA ligase [Sphingomonas sp. 67-36]